MVAKSLQSCPTLCNPIDGSPPGSPVPGILQAVAANTYYVPIAKFANSSLKKISKIFFLVMQLNYSFFLILYFF